MILLDLGFACFAGYFISKLMNGGEFDLVYCVAGVIGVFVVPPLIAIGLKLAQVEFELGSVVSSGASAAIGCLAYDALRRVVAAVRE